ncbi:MAG: Pur operon repressor [Candidatus Dichloromethanomonas elyunquensis]|nr:MAG: Pur operon repressor [Candidatus Dichloromethanomonas elyunquensis]
MKRTERLIALTEILLSRPNELLSLGFFADCFDTAKSTISEDMVAIKETLSLTGKGRLETVPGAAGGVKFLPSISKKEAQGFLQKLAASLSTSERMLPGGFLYMADLLYDPAVVRPLGLIFASIFRSKNPEAVVTIETKGIPLALMTADALGIPAVVVRHGNKVTEGSSVSINYVSGSSKRIQTMTLARRALGTGKKVLIIDDFIKAGGTAKGIMTLMQEFNAEVVGLGILMEDAIWNTSRLIDQYFALLQFVEIDPSIGKTVVKANIL